MTRYSPDTVVILCTAHDIRTMPKLTQCRTAMLHTNPFSLVKVAEMRFQEDNSLHTEILSVGAATDD